MKPKQFLKTCLLSTAFLFAAGPHGASQARKAPAPLDPVSNFNHAAKPLALLQTITPPQTAETIYDSIGRRLADANAKYGSIAINAANGDILLGTNIDKKLRPASLTKVLTAYMVFEALENGTVTLQQKLTVSAHAAGMETSSLGLKAGTTITLEDALKGMMVKSANDAAVVLAEAIGGTHAKFVTMMNKTAADLGMTQSKFVNANGLPYDLKKNRDINSISSVKDMATLMRAILQKHPEQYKYFGMTSFTYKGVKNGNHNKMLPGVQLTAKDTTKQYEGMDGGKTGYTLASGCNIVCSATKKDSLQNEQRLIVVTFGHKTGKDRTADIRRLLDAGFIKLAQQHNAAAEFRQINANKMENPVRNKQQGNGIFKDLPASTRPVFGWPFNPF